MTATGLSVRDTMKALAKADTCKTCGKRRGVLGTLNAAAKTKKRGFKAEVIPDDQKCTCPAVATSGAPATAADDYSPEGIMARLESGLAGMLATAPDPYGIKDEETAEQQGSPGAGKPPVGESTPTSPALAPAAPVEEQSDDICPTCGATMAHVADDRDVPPGTIGPRYTVCFSCHPEEERDVEDVQAPSLTDQLRRLAVARQALQSAANTVSEKRAELELELSGVVAAANVARAQVEQLESEVRAAAELTFRATGEKKPVAGIEVKEFTVMTYEPAKALEWARSSGIALSLDRSAFEKVAKVTPLPFVTIDTEPRAQIATKLTQYLPAEDATDG